MVSDQEPRYRLVDDEGNIVGSLYGKADGSVAIQETASGADREVALAPDGTFSAPSVDTQSVSTEDARVTGDQLVTINVPTDEATVADAVVSALHIVPNADISVEVNIESGHEWESELAVEQVDARHITIISEDATVSVGSGFPTDGDLITADQNSHAPRLNCVIDGSGQDVNRGYRLTRSSVGRVMLNGGVTNVDRGLSVTTDSHVNTSTGATFANCNERGAEISNGSYAFINDLDVSGSDTIGLRAGSSHVDADGIDASGSGGNAVSATNGSVVSLIEADLSDAGGDGIFAEGVLVWAQNVDTTGATDNGVDAEFGAIVACEGGTLSTDENPVGGRGINAIAANQVVALNATINGCGGRGVNANTGSRVALNSASVDNAAGQGIFTDNGSEVGITNGTVEGSGITDLVVNEGSKIQCGGTTTTSSTAGDPHEDDMSQTPNTVTGSGIIFAESTEQ